MITDICRQSGDGAGFRARAATHADAADMDLLDYDGESQAGFEG